MENKRPPTTASGGGEATASSIAEIRRTLDSLKGESGAIGGEGGDLTKGQLVGGEDTSTDKKRIQKPRRGRVLTVGGVRSVKYYQWTIHELGMLGSRRASAMRSLAIAAFAGGLVADGIKDALLNPPAPGTAKGVWVTLLIVAAVVCVYNLVIGLARGRKAEQFQEDVINEHDFGD